MTRSLPLLKVVFAAALCVALGGCVEADPPSYSPFDTDHLYGTQLPEGESAEVPSDNIKDATVPYLESLANLLVTDDESFDENALQQAQALAPNSLQQEKLSEQLRAWRDILAPEVTYDRAEAFVHPDVQVLGDDGRLYVGANVEYKLHIKGGHDEGSAEHHVFVYEKQGDAWKLVEDRLCEPLSLLPESDSGALDNKSTPSD